jgi:hypothetical protein
MHIRPALALAALLALPSPGATLTVDPLVPVPRPGAPVPCEMRIAGIAAGELMEGRLGFLDDRRNLVVTGPEWVLQGPESVRGFLLPSVSFDAQLTPVWLPAGKESDTRLRGTPLAFKGEFTGRPPILVAVLHDHERDLIPARRFASRLTPKPFRTELDMTPVPLAAAQAPQMPLGWTAYDLVVAPASALEALSSDQLEALRAWIRAGGRLVLPAASWPRLAWDGRPEPDTPVSWLGFGRVWLHDWGNAEAAPPEDQATAFFPVEREPAKETRIASVREFLQLQPGRVISTGGLILLGLLIIAWIALERRLFSRSRWKAWVWLALPVFCILLTSGLVLMLNVINPAQSQEKTLVMHDVSPEGWLTRTVTVRHVLSGRSMEAVEKSRQGWLFTVGEEYGPAQPAWHTGFPGEGHTASVRLGPWSHVWFATVEIPRELVRMEPDTRSADVGQQWGTRFGDRQSYGNNRDGQIHYLRRPLGRPGQEPIQLGEQQAYYNHLPPEFLPLPFNVPPGDVRVVRAEKNGVVTLHRFIRKLE